MLGDDSKPVVGLVAPLTTMLTFDDVIQSAVVKAAMLDEEDAADAKATRLRTRGPGKGRRAESVHLLTIAIQALQTAREAALLVRQDMPPHERERLLIAPVSDCGLAIRSVQEALERWERGAL